MLLSFVGKYELTFTCTVSLMRLLLILCLHPQFGRTPLSLAALNGRLPIIKLLVQRGANVRHCNNVSNVNSIRVPMLTYLHTCHCVIVVYYPCIAHIIHVSHVLLSMYIM